MIEPGRKYAQAGSGYRYGFNGKEKDPNITGEDYDFGGRIYDGRLGRWLSVDRFLAKYPSLSTYSFAANGPIYFTDHDGNVITDPSGKEIKFTEVNGTLVFSNNADVYAQIYIATMYKTEMGKTYLKKLQDDTRKIAFINPPQGWSVDENGSSTSFGEVEEKKIVDAYIKREKVFKEYIAAADAVQKTSVESKKFDIAVKAFDQKELEYQKSLETYDKLVAEKYKWDESKGVSVQNDQNADLYIMVSSGFHMAGSSPQEKTANSIYFTNTILKCIKGEASYTDAFKYIKIPELINTLVEEAFHTQQKEFNYYKPELVPGTNKYKQGASIDHDDRAHEIEAQHEAKKAQNEYENKKDGG